MRQAALFLVLIFTAALVQAQAPAPESPKRKSGLWEIKNVRSEDKAWVVKMCVDQATDDALLHLNGPARKESCKADKVQRSGDQTTVDAVCTQSRSTATTHAVITGKFDSAYKVETKSTYDPPLRGKAEGTTTLEARWLGPCGADQKPGDVVLDDGRKVSMSDRVPGGASARKKSQAAPGAPSTPSSSRQSSPATPDQGGSAPSK